MSGKGKLCCPFSFDRSICKYENDITKNLLCQYVTYPEWKKNSSSKNIHHFTFETLLIENALEKKNENSVMYFNLSKI